MITGHPAGSPTVMKACLLACLEYGKIACRLDRALPCKPAFLISCKITGWLPDFLAGKAACRASFLPAYRLGCLQFGKPGRPAGWPASRLSCRHASLMHI